jgi:hypothetical protein
VTRTLRPGSDRHLLAPAFAVRFRDRLDGAVVWEGLRVELSDSRRPREVRRLAANPHGVFVAHRVPRVGAAASPPAVRALTVRDPLGRYVPLRMDAVLPADGLFRPPCLSASPPEGEPHVPLFSAVTRTVPPHVAQIRADLRLASNPAVAAPWARLSLWLGDRLLAEGVADRDGAALLLCPLPPLSDPPLRGSPPGGDGPPLRWDVTLRAGWAPALAGQDVPDLCALLELPEVPLLERAAPPRPLGPLVLEGGVPRVVRSADASYLLVAA